MFFWFRGFGGLRGFRQPPIKIKENQMAKKMDNQIDAVIGKRVFKNKWGSLLESCIITILVSILRAPAFGNCNF